MALHNELGKKGERLAIDYLIKKGYAILDENWRFQKAEVDIIAQIKDTLVAVEVKTRSTSDFGNLHGRSAKWHPCPQSASGTEPAGRHRARRNTDGSRC